MANTKISQLTANTNPNGGEELVYAYNNANGKMTLNTMKTFAGNGKQDTLVSGTNIKTINNTSLLGSGNIDIAGTNYTAGTGIDITGTTISNTGVTSIKTINGSSIEGTGNVDISGGVAYTAGTGIDITAGVISATGGGGVTTLNADANIWELSDGVYETTYDLYYKTGSKITYRITATGRTIKQRISVTKDTSGAVGFMVFNVSHKVGNGANAFFGYSASSSDGQAQEIRDYHETMTYYQPRTGDDLGVLGASLTHVYNSVYGAQSTEVSANSLRAGLTYTIIVQSASSNYTVTLGTGITNPLSLALPSNTTKPCVMTFVATDESNAVLTGCTIGN